MKKPTKTDKTIKKTKSVNEPKKSRKISPTLGAIFVICVSFLLDNIVILIINAIQHPILFKIFYTITLLGETYTFIWIAIISTAILLINRRPILAYLLTLSISGILGWLIKFLIQRPRPFETLNIPSNITTNLSSFPSGHTLMFFSIIPVMSKNFPKIKGLFWTIAILVGVSRIYLGVHYFSDVLAGAIIGYAIGWICMKCGEKYGWSY